MKTPALKSFYGASENSQKREQSILTPPSIVDGLERLWPDGVDLDPCSCAGSLVKAHNQLFVNGLSSAWFGNVYVNEPFKELKLWLAKSQREASRPEVYSIVNLCPWRSRRRWFRATYRGANGVMLLDPVVFYDSSTMEPWKSPGGQVTQFPENMCLLYWGERVDAFRAAFADVGEPL